jgi:peptidoglycan/LPS O-acetylase OafA/YrhL
MEIQRFRLRLFYLLLGAKVAVILWLLVLWLSHGYSAGQFRELLLLIAPLFVANITIALKFWLGEKQPSPAPESRKVAGPIRTIVWWGTIGYGIYMIFLLTYFSTLTGDEDAYRNLKELISLGEILFGGYIGLVVADVFTRE